jgi:hypothetical protein
VPSGTAGIVYPYRVNIQTTSFRAWLVIIIKLIVRYTATSRSVSFKELAEEEDYFSR